MVVFKEEETLDDWKTETMTGEDGGWQETIWQVSVGLWKLSSISIQWTLFKELKCGTKQG